MTAPLTALLGIGEGQARVDGSDPSGTLLGRPAGGASLPTVTARRVGGTRYPPICADVVWIPMKVRATQIRLIWAGRAARDVDWILDPKDCYGHGGVGPQLARPA